MNNEIPQKSTLREVSLSQTQQAMLKALEKHLGIVTHACKEAGIDRKTHYNWMAENQTYKELVDSLEDLVLDFAESSLFAQMKDKNPSSTQFFLRYRGKKRGYIEKQQIELSGGLDVNMQQLTDEQLQAIAAGEGISGIGTTAKEKGENNI